MTLTKLTILLGLVLILNSTNSPAQSVATNGVGSIQATNMVRGPLIDGHEVNLSFRWELVTNSWTHSMSYGASEWNPYDEWYAVDSNYVAVLVIDGKTNEVIQQGMGRQLGEVHRRIQPYRTNCILSETFETNYPPLTTDH